MVDWILIASLVMVGIGIPFIIITNWRDMMETKEILAEVKEFLKRGYDLTTIELKGETENYLVNETCSKILTQRGEEQ